MRAQRKRSREKGSTWERRAWHDGEEPAPARGWRDGPFGCRNRGRPERGLVREGGNGRLGASGHSLNLDLTPEKRPLLQSQLTPQITCGTRRARALRGPVRVRCEIGTCKARDRPYRQVHRVCSPL